MMKRIHLLLFFIILLLIHSIQCQTEESSTQCSTCNKIDSGKKCECTGDQDKDCMWIKIKSGESQCMKCNDIDKGDSKYYSVKFTVENKPYCHKVGKSGYSGAKMYYGTKQIVSNCNELGLNTLGDYCFDSCPTNSAASNSKCNCQNLFYKEIKEGLIYINCLQSGNSCEDGYNYINDNECLKACPENKPYLQKYSAESKDYLCKEECDNYKYSEKAPSGKINTYCVSECPQNKKFYYSDNICLEKCSRNIKDFYNSNKKCIDSTSISSSDCGGQYYINVFPEKYIFQCVEQTGNPCSEEFPYLYEANSKKYCLKSCEDTKIEFLDNVETYTYEDSGQKKCLDISLDNLGLFKIEKEKRFVSDCSQEVYWPYHKGNECVSNCGDKYIDINTNECLDDCRSGFHRDEETKMCIQNCPDYLGRGYYDEITNKCVSCGKNTDGTWSGFHKIDNNDKMCYSSCPEGFKHNHLNNICFNGNCKDVSDYKFSYAQHPEICYYTCKDIGNDYNVEKDYQCYKDSEIDVYNSFEGYYFYEISYEDSYKYKKFVEIEDNKALNECFINNLKYLRGNQCVSQCNENEYKVLPTNNKFGKCYNTFSDCINNNIYKFYNINSKICSETCDQYMLVDNTGNTKVTGGNCLNECPNDYPYLDGKICKNKCNECYIEEDGIKKCVSKVNYFIKKVGEHNKCVKYCTNSIKEKDDKGVPIFSYYDSNKNCLDSCIGNTDNEYSYEAINTHQPCLPNCKSDEYYYDEKKICLKKCDKFIKGKNSPNDRICVENCDNEEKILPNNICSDQCDKNAPFFYEYEGEGTGDNTHKVYKCVQSCLLIEGFQYFNFGNNECLRSVPPDMTNYAIYHGGIRENCPSGFSEEPDSATHKCIIISDQSSSCEIYITTYSECLSKCPLGEHFIQKGEEIKNCKDKCESTEFYRKEEENDDYIIYKCVDSCTDPYPVYIEGTKECIPNCGNLYEYDGVCYADCGDDKYSIYDSTNLKYICKDGGCDSNYPFTEKDKKICKEDCTFISSKIAVIEDSSKYCVSSCDDEETNNVLEIREDNKLYCSSDCQRKDEDSICMPKCKNYKNYVSDNKCLDECPNLNTKTNEADDEIQCSTECIDTTNIYTYQNENICLTSCYPGDYVKSGSKNCAKECSSFNTDSEKYYYYEDTEENKCVTSCAGDKPYLRKNDHCDTECDSNPLGDYYYKEGTNICITKSECDAKIDGRICRDNCDSSSINKYFDNEEFCISNCYYSTKGYIYHINDQYICQNLDSDYILNDNILESSCSNDNYKLAQQCILQCPKTLNFLLNDHNCLNDCSDTLPYYTQTEINSIKNYQCTTNCKAYAITDNKYAKYCLGDECNSLYPYYTSDSYPKECYRECPTSYDFYYIPETESTKLYKCVNSNSIPMDYILIDGTNKYIKQSECYPNYINKDDSNKCISKCSENQVMYKDENNNNYCASNCNIIQEGLHLDLNGKECVKGDTCLNNEKMITLQDNNKQCDCENLYYNDITTGIKVCIDKNEINCTKQIEYPYLIKGTKECSHTCNGIISLNGTDCYTSNTYKCPENSQLDNDGKQCICKDKYYHYETDVSKEIYCLPPDTKCPRNETFNRELLITDTSECVEYCPFEKQTKKYGKTCVELCPIMSVVVNDECFCQDEWYMDENDEMICCNECPENKPIIIDETKECVSTCINTEYPVFYKNKCYKDCSKFQETDRINNIKSIETLEDSDDANYKYKGYYLSNLYGEYGENICYCKGPWYEDEDEAVEGCDNNKDNLCTVFDNIYSYKYTVLPTKQCVKKCPKYFEHNFNDYCFSSCEEGNELLKNIGDNKANGLLIDDANGSPVCKCAKLWKYNNEDPSKLECIEGETCPDDLLLIFETNECYSGTQCKQDHPLLFNNICYNKDNCPKNTIFNPDSPKTCSCINYYYIDEKGIECLGEEDDCSGEYPNLIYSRDKCVKDGDEELVGLFNFNGIYYNNCPLYTIYDEEEKKCVCNTLYGYWYKDETEGNYLHCRADGCPDEKPYLLISTWECLAKCNTEGKKYVEYNGICYEECPELTKENANGVCELQEVVEAKNMTEFTKVITDNIVSLYTISKKEDSDNTNNNGNEGEDDEKESESKIIELVDNNLTVEFYGVNNNKKENKEKHNNKNKTSSSLSYIDLSECIQSIYESNNMRPEDDIIILKFDKKDTPADYLINPVEYKFINSRNGQQLDASICSKGAIKISYPFSNIISNYDKLLNKHKRNLKNIMISLENDNDLNNLKEKYNIGKEIYEEFSYVDTFNSKDKIYTDYCTAVEINGKDLILEDRMNYLLPHYSLCEKNCSYNHTDFDEERIYCDCSFKSEFDLNREHDSILDINENAVIKSQNGETNFPVLKCISVLSDSKRIKKNIGFYYMLIIIIIEVALLIMTILFGYKSFKSFFSDKVCDNDITDHNIKVNNLDENEQKNTFDEIIKTSHRLNAPPKKSNNGEEINEENNNNNENNDNNGENINNNNDEFEFIPEEFVFLYFNDSDKGVRKKVDRNMLPFTVKENTKILLQKMENVDYEGVKASGPFHEDQNMIEIEGGVEEKVNINIESINESLFDNDGNINEKNKITNKKNNEKELVTISEEKIYKRENIKIFKINEFDEMEEELNKEKEIKLNLLDEMKVEQRLLTKNYDFVKDKNESGLFILILTEILDKIYLTRTILFIRKFDIMFLDLSVYALYHVILLNILAMLYDIKTIKNIWNKENYPGFGLHLGYGLLSLLVTWVIYLIIMCLLTNKGKYNEILNIKNSKKKSKEKKTELINKKYEALISKMKIKLIIYYIVQFILIIFFFIYLLALGAVFPGTMKKIFASYGVAILEVIIIKILYGLILGILRSVSLSGQKSGMYNIVKIFDKYIV